MISAVLEQKVWVTTSSPLYPNTYIVLVGNAGIGKTRPIMAAMSMVKEIPEMHLGATSMTMASMTDYLVEAKRQVIRLPDPPLDYNSMYCIADELSAFMHEFDTGLIAGLTTFYDCVPYSQGRRVGNIKIKINRPQISILAGSTPSNLVNTIPEQAWEQGFTSRVMLIYSEERPIIDVFNTPKKPVPVDMLHDLKQINTLQGEFGWEEEFAVAMHTWKTMGYPPVPTHPKLAHYNSRRFAHLIKLAMVSSVDRGNSLVLTLDDFNRAREWMLEAELRMPSVFKGGSGGVDAKAMDEIHHFVRSFGDQGVSEQKIVNFARLHVQNAYSIKTILDVMKASGQLQTVKFNPKLGQHTFKAGSEE